jgi:chromosome partitioning protein
VDSSPGWDPLTVAVMFYVKELLVPVSLEVMSVQGLTQFLKSYLSIKRYHKELQLKYILPTFMDKRNENSLRILDRMEEVYGRFLLTPIRYSLRLMEAPAYGMTIFEYAGGDPVVRDFKTVVKEIKRENKLIDGEGIEEE